MLKTSLPFNNRFLVLDGLRGLAALMVVWGHLAAMTGIWFPGRVLAVDLFFMISGFIIPFSYQEKLAEGMGFLKFAEVRVTRLYPLYILGCMISLVPYICFAIKADSFQPLQQPVSWLPWALVVLPKPAWEAQHSFLLNPPAWTLSLEYIMNFAWVVFLPWLTNRVVMMFVAVMTGLLAIAVFHFGTIDFGTGGVEFIWGLSRVGCPFLIGVALHRLWLAGNLPRLHLPVVITSVVFLATVPLCASRLEGPLLDWLTVVLIFPALIVIGIASKATGWSARVSHWLGEISYPIYALHLPLLASAGQMAAFVHVSSRAAEIVTAPFVVVIAALSVKVYDRPARRFIQTLFGLRRRDVTAAPAI